MSLETLLEAAKYLEYRSEAKARGEEPHDYTTYAKLANGGGGSLPGHGSSSAADHTPPNHGDDYRERRRTVGAGTREVHNKLEKNRRAHLKECFEGLKKQIPSMDDKKTSNLSILRSALRYIQALKRKEREYEHEMERLAREKISQQQRLATLKKELSLHLESVDMNPVDPDEDADNDSNSTTTASEIGPLSDAEEERTLVQKTEKNNPLVPSASGKMVIASSEANLVKTASTSNSAVIAYASAASSTTKPVPITNSSFPIPLETTVPQVTSQSMGHIQSSAHLQIPSQVMNPVGIRVNNSGNIVAHQTTMQMITQQGVRVISAASGSSLPTTLPNVSPATTATTATINVVAQKVNSTAAAPSPSPSLPSSTPTITKPPSMSTLTLTKSNLLPVAAQTSPGVTTTLTQGKALMANLPTLTIPTTLSSLARTMTLQTTPVSTQEIVSFTSIGGAAAIQVSGSNIKPNSQILQQTLAQQRTILPPAVRGHTSSHTSSGGTHINNIPRQIVTTAVKPMAQVRAPLTQITHVVQPTTLTSVGQLVPPGNHMSTMTSLMGPVSVVNHAVAQVITQPPLGKVTVTASPILKPVNQIPLLQQQFLSSSQSVVKPVVVVTTPSMANIATSSAQATIAQTPVTLSVTHC